MQIDAVITNTISRLSFDMQRKFKIGVNFSQAVTHTRPHFDIIFDPQANNPNPNHNPDP